MHFSINIPNFGEFADARTVAAVATAPSKRAGRVVRVESRGARQTRAPRSAVRRSWMLLTAALATSRIRLARWSPGGARRPEQLARQVATLDSMSGAG